MYKGWIFIQPFSLCTYPKVQDKEYTTGNTPTL